MSGFMGYHPEHLRWLRDAIRRALDDLEPIRCSDALARDAMDDVRAARSLLEGWLPFLDSLIGCNVMTDYQQHAIDADDVRHATMWGLAESGWRVLTDPLDGDAIEPLLPADARGLARMISEEDVHDLVDSDAELIWLVDRLTAIEGDAELRAAFDDVLAAGDAPWVALMDALAARRVSYPVENRVPIDAMFTVIARFHDERGAQGALLDEPEPYAAALVFQHLDRTPDEMAEDAYRILERWWSDDGSWLDSSSWAGERTADILYRHLVCTPDAASAFLHLVMENHPPMLFTTAHSQTSTEMLLRIGMDPGRIDVETAGEIVRPALDWVIHSGHVVGIVGDGLGPSLLSLSATMVTPYLMHFGARADEWGWTQDEGDEALRSIIRDPVAMDQLVAELERWRGQFVSTRMIEGGDVDNAMIDDIAETFTRLALAFEDEAISDAAEAHFWVDAGVFLADFILGFVPMKKATSLAIDILMPRLIDALEGSGVLPSDPDDVREAEMRKLEGSMVHTAVVVVAALTLQLIDQGMLEPDVMDDFTFDRIEGECRPEEMRDRLQDFVRGLPLDAATYDAVWGSLNAVLNVESTLLLCDRRE